MNQAFNTESFLKIFYNENRKGNYLEKKFSIFKKIKLISDKIIEINKTERQTSKKVERLKKKKHSKLKIILEKIEKNIEEKKYKLEIKSDLEIKGKRIYTIDDTSPEIFFIFKKIQSNIQRSFKVKQSDRNEIVHQVKNLLDNDLPKYIIRTDIKNFFESIPHEKLKKKINKNHILNSDSKKIINTILWKYKEKISLEKGIPRGIGISAYLSELYMRDIDNKIKSLPNITYYARYVDDIIVIFTPNAVYNNSNYLQDIRDIIEKEELETNEDKTAGIGKETYKFDFLGYNFKKNCKEDIIIGITKTKLKKYKNKIDIAIDLYNKESKFDEKKARKLLVKRLKYLTENTRLLNVKKDIVIGIYFLNRMLTSYASLEALDKYLKNKIDKDLKPHSKLKHIDSDRLKNRLQKFSFKEGFKKKKFCEFTTKDFQTILKPWKKL